MDADADTQLTRFASLLAAWVAAEEGRTEATFARLLKLHPSTLSRIKAGLSQPTTATLAAACTAMGADRDACLEIYSQAGHVLPEALTAAEGI